MSELDVVLETPDVLAVDKPAGMLSIAGRRGGGDPRPCALHDLAARYGGKIWVVHRLDLEVAGLLVFARSADAHRALCRLFETRGVRKTYEAWTEGAPPLPVGAELVWESRLARGRRRVWESPDGKWSRTAAVCGGRIVWRGSTLAAWTLAPETGRPHQLRCHLAARGWPVAGDRLYGSALEFLPGAIALRAVRLDFAALPPAERERFGLPAALEVPGAAVYWCGAGPAA